MTKSRFDVIVVGARCAGAALAARLARAGASVLMVDAATMPSGQRTSTHLIQPPGMDELDDLALGSAVRATTPALTAMRLAFDGHEAVLSFGDGRAAHCLRRERLDPLLQAAAGAAGAELRDRTKVVEITRAPDGAVNGVVVRRDGRERESLHADLVVGADGRGSTIAKLVGAREYLAYDGPRACYWAYWPRPPGWDRGQLCNLYRADDAYVVFPTDADQLLIASAPPVERALSWRRDHAASYLESVRSHEPIGSRLGAEPASEVRGVLRTRYFFRTSAGRGWALVGDAGHHKEFFLGLGISDALRDARSFAEALIVGGQDAAAAWWRGRDAERVELYYWGRDLGRATSVDALRRLTADRIKRTPQLSDRLGPIIDGRLSPFDLVPPAQAMRWIAQSLRSGDPGPLAPFLAAAVRRVVARRQLRVRRRLLARARRAYSAPTTLSSLSTKT